MRIETHFELLQWVWVAIGIAGVWNLNRLASAVADLGYKFNHWIWVWQKKNSTPQ